MEIKNVKVENNKLYVNTCKDITFSVLDKIKNKRPDLFGEQKSFEEVKLNNSISTMIIEDITRLCL